jgi:hypothetical protein
MNPGHKMRFTGRLLMPRWLLSIVYPPCSEYIDMGIDMGNDKMLLAGIQVFGR